MDDLQEADFAAEAATGKARWHGADKKGQACVVVRPRLHNPSSTDATGLMRYGAFMMEQGVRLTEANGCESVCVIYDRLGMTRKNVDLGQVRHGGRGPGCGARTGEVCTVKHSARLRHRSAVLSDSLCPMPHGPCAERSAL